MDGGTAAEGTEAEAGYDAGETREVPWLPAGIATGVVAGTIVGVALGALFFGIGIGLAVGMAVGTAMDLVARDSSVDEDAI